MTGATSQGVWVTLQAHTNVVAVAALLELSAVIITEGAMPKQAVIDKANEEDIILLSTERPTFHVVGKLWEMGLRDS
jgi:predicted transcriptional regulator